MVKKLREKKKKMLTEELGSQRGPEKVRGSRFIPHILAALKPSLTSACQQTHTGVYFPTAGE